MKKRVSGLRYLHVNKEYVLLRNGEIVKDGKRAYEHISKRRFIRFISNCRDYIKEEIYWDRKRSKLDIFMDNRYKEFNKY